jgi:hypothetical protein
MLKSLKNLDDAGCVRNELVGQSTIGIPISDEIAHSKSTRRGPLADFSIIAPLLSVPVEDGIVRRSKTERPIEHLNDRMGGLSFEVRATPSNSLPRSVEADAKPGIDASEADRKPSPN